MSAAARMRLAAEAAEAAEAAKHRKPLILKAAVKQVEVALEAARAEAKAAVTTEAL